MVGEGEAPLERAVGNAAVDIVGAILVALLAADEQLVLLARDFDVVLAEAGDCNFDPIAVVVDLDEVEGRVVLAAEIAVLEHVEQAVEADAGAAEVSKVECTAHVLSSILSNKAGQEAGEASAPSPGPSGARRRRDNFCQTDFKTPRGSLRAIRPNGRSSPPVMG